MINTALVSPNTVREVLHKLLCLSSMVSVSHGSLPVLGVSTLEAWFNVNASPRLDKQVMKLVKLVVRSGIIP